VEKDTRVNIDDINFTIKSLPSDREEKVISSIIRLGRLSDPFLELRDIPRNVRETLISNNGGKLFENLLKCDMHDE
jgi:hypothetical protein